MSSNPIPHQAIEASAGTGKTWQLARRYLNLLALGTEPERIIALTFTRKAAGEIFDRIVNMLCDCASDPVEAAAVAKTLDAPFTTDDADRILAHFLSQLGRVRTGTLDSFMVGSALAFQQELGLSGQFEVCDASGPAGSELQQLALERLLLPKHALSDAQEAFLAAYRLATFGQDDKAVVRGLRKFTDLFTRMMDALDDISAWGDPLRIWPEGEPWQGLTDEAIEEAIDALMEKLPLYLPGKRESGAMEKVIAILSENQITDSFPKLSTFGDQLLAHLPDWGVNPVTITYFKKEYTLPPTYTASLRVLFLRLFREHLGHRLIRSAGIRSVLATYTESYREACQRLARLSFDDVQRLLDPQDPFGPGWSLASGSRAATEKQLVLEERFDARLDHWLIDEFQDTSDRQWNVLAPLMDEILQDPDGQRTLFYVGDVKQAIYGWRGGNAELFHDILATYGDAPIDTKIRLMESRRSAAPVIDLVNAVFSDVPEDLKGAALWKRHWQKHTTHPDNPPQNQAHAAVLVPNEDSDDPVPGRHRTTLELLQRTRPLEKGLTCAILVRTNDDAEALVELLRREVPDMPVTLEGSTPVADNALADALIHTFTWLAHPTDLRSRTWLRLSTLPVDEMDTDTPFTPAALWRSVHRDGLEGTSRHILDRLEESCGPWDVFAAARRDTLLALAREEDRAGSRDPDRLVAAIQAHLIGQDTAAQTIRIMTIHKCKGLGFDMVVVPFLTNRTSFVRPQRSFLQHNHPDRSLDWIIPAPPKALVDADPALSEASQLATDREAYETWCVLYVALTRAVRACYVTLPEKCSEGALANAFALLPTSPGALAPLDGVDAPVQWQSGNPDWFKEVEGAEEESPSEAPRPLPSPRTLRDEPVSARGYRASNPPGKKTPMRP